MTDKKYIEELETWIAQMQKELERLKTPEEEKKDQDLYGKYESELMHAMNPAWEVHNKIMEEGAQGIITLINTSSFEGTITRSAGSCIFNSLDDLNEDDLAAVLDIFANPRRITILKLLLPKSMTVTEISQHTGLDGGQLYHHLLILENAGLISKKEEKYKSDFRAPIILCGLYAALGGDWRVKHWQNH